MISARLAASAVVLLTTTTSLRAETVDIDSVGLPRNLGFVGRYGTSYSATHAILQPFSLVPTEDASALLGKGYNVFTGEVSADAPCIESDGHDGPAFDPKVAVTGDDYFYNEIVTSFRSYTNSSSLGANFGFTYKLISLSFKDENTSESIYNTTDAFGRFYRRIVTYNQFRDGGQWSKNANSWLRNGQITTFVKACGTHYVRAILWGSSIDQNLHFSLNEQNYNSSDSASLSLGVKDLLSFGIDDKTSEKSVSKLSRITHSGHDHGVVVPPENLKDDVGGVQSLYHYATFQFPQAVANAHSKGDILMLDIRPYSERILPGIGKIPAWPEQIFAILLAKQNMIQDFATAADNLRFAVKLTEPQYAALYDGNYADVAGKLDRAENARTKLKTAVDYCNSLMLSASNPLPANVKKCTDDVDTALNEDVLKSVTIHNKQ